MVSASKYRTHERGLPPDNFPKTIRKEEAKTGTQRFSILILSLSLILRETWGTSMYLNL